MELREQIARQILWLRSPGAELGLVDPEWQCADAILSIPEIGSGIALYLASIEERDPD